MRILHVLHQYLPEKVGGTELYTRTLARHQTRLGHEVALFTPATANTDWPLPQVEDRLRIYRVPLGERDARTIFRSNFHQPFIANAFKQVQHRETPDLVHVQHLMGLPWNLVQSINVPLVITLHDYWYLCANAQLITNFNNTICNGPKGWLNCAHCALARAGHSRALPLIPFLAPLFGFRHLQLRRVLQQAQSLIAPSQFTANVYEQMGISAQQIIVIPHGIHVPTQIPEHYPHKGLHIAYIGGLAWQKGIHVLIEAVNQLPHKDVKLSIFGDMAVFPDYVEQLTQNATHPGIAFYGRLPHEELWKTLANIDLLVVPTLWYETSSLIIQEAQAAGVPVLASQIGAVQERLRQGIDGYYFPPGDVDTLVMLLRRFVDHPELVAQLRSGIQPVTTMDEHVTRVNIVYEQACSVPS